MDANPIPVNSSSCKVNQIVTISIVTPSFKQVEHLKCCSASVRDQQGEFTFEHLVQDGLSGPELVEWSAQQTFAQVVSEPDGGMYDAINRGFGRAKGEILAWLNCDEQYLPGALANVAEWFDRNPGKDILFGDVVLITSSGEPLSYRKAVLPMRGHIRSCFLSTYSAATFVRRKVIENGYYLDTRFRVIADAVWIDALLKGGFQAGVLNEPLALFTQTGDNLGQSPLAAQESSQWRKECGAGSFWKRNFWSVVHRVRKFLHGAYRKRDIEILFHAPGHIGRKRSQARVGEIWRTRS
jgi:glycosyltransferase involved in cell wall biosynthesis